MRHVARLATEIVAITGLVAAVFGAFLFLDDRHAHEHELAEAKEQEYRRMLMSQSTRYAEIEKYYVDEMRQGNPLSEAQKARLELVQRQQIRIAAELLEE